MAIVVCALWSPFILPTKSIRSVASRCGILGLPVTFCIDRAGFIGEDGETHQGLYDMAMLTAVHGMQVFAPSNEAELTDMRFAKRFPLTDRRPFAIRGKPLLPFPPTRQRRMLSAFSRKCEKCGGKAGCFDYNLWADGGCGPFGGENCRRPALGRCEMQPPLARPHKRNATGVGGKYTGLRGKCSHRIHRTVYFGRLPEQSTMWSVKTAEIPMWYRALFPEQQARYGLDAEGIWKAAIKLAAKPDRRTACESIT